MLPPCRHDDADIRHAAAAAAAAAAAPKIFRRCVIRCQSMLMLMLPLMPLPLPRADDDAAAAMMLIIFKSAFDYRLLLFISSLLDFFRGDSAFIDADARRADASMLMIR